MNQKKLEKKTSLYQEEQDRLHREEQEWVDIDLYNGDEEEEDKLVAAGREEAHHRWTNDPNNEVLPLEKALREISL